MRTVLFGLGTRGDVELLITLGRELLHNGHTVVIGAHDFYGPRVEAAGLQFSALGHGTQADLQSIIRGLAAYRSPLQRTQQYYLQWLKPQLASVQVELAKLVGHADYFASNLKMVFRRGRRLIPTARITYDLPHKLSDLDKYGPICPEVLDLVALPKRLIDPDHRWNERFKFSGFWLPSATGTGEPLQRLVDFVSAMPAPVVVTMGSMAMFDAKRFLQVICETARQLDFPVVVVSSWSGMQTSTESNVCVVDEAPYDWLFPRSRCVIHHGGCGTTAAVLAAGTLSVVSPQISCQVDLAQTLIDNNLVLATIDAASVDSSGLVNVIQQINNDTSHQEALQQWKEAIPLDMGAAGAARLVDNHYQSLS